MKSANLPPLVTGSPPGTALADTGVPGAPGTAVLFGGSPVDGDLRVGGRVTAGLWLDGDRTFGVEAYFFQVGTQTQGFTGGVSRYRGPAPVHHPERSAQRRVGLIPGVPRR